MFTNRSFTHLNSVLFAVSLALFSLISVKSSSAESEYLLGGGDVLLLSINGSPQLSGKKRVDANGRISIPLLGEIRVQGQSIRAAREAIETKLRESNLIPSPVVSLEVDAYRPYYISGHVSRPGAYPYRPSATVRNAVAVAGGYGLSDSLGGKQIDIPDVTAKFKSLWHELFEKDARTKSLKAELEGKKDLSLQFDKNAPLDPQFADWVTKLESQHLKVRLEKMKKDVNRIKKSIELASQEEADLKNQLTQEKEGLKLLEGRLAKSRTLRERGLIKGPRVEEQAQLVTQVRSRIFEVSSRNSRVAREIVELKGELSKVQEERHLLALREMQLAMLERERVRSQLEAMGEKLLRAGSLIALSETFQKSDPLVRIHRNKNGKQVSIEADLNEPIKPDDVIEIVLKPSVAKFPWRVKELSSGENFVSDAVPTQ